MIMKKAQLAYEFLLVLFFLTMFFTAFTMIVAAARERVLWDETVLQIEDLGLGLQHEFYTVIAMPDGFSKNFILPVTLQGTKYSVSVSIPSEEDGRYTLFIQGFDDELFYTFDLPPFMLGGDLRLPPESNILSKKDGLLYLNEVSS